MNARTPSKIEQDEEARNRVVRDDAGNELGTDPRQTAVNDAVEEALGDPEPRQIERDEPEPRERPKPVYMSPADQKRAEFAKRFKRDDDGDVPYNGNPNDPEMAYGKFGREDGPEPEPEPQPEPQAREAPQGEKKFTIRVRGKELHLTEAELLERASKVEAADQYLDEGRNLLEQARDIRRNNNAERTGEESHRPEARTSTQDDERNPASATEDGQRPDPLEQAIEEIQFGDPKEAAGKIRKVIADVSDESADQRQMNRLLQKDALTSVNAIKAFKDQHSDLDEDAERWIENKLYDLQRAEIVSLGVVDADKIPKDTKALARWHQFYRVNGANVSDQAKLLTEAKGRLDKWRGVAPKPAATQQRREAPRVEVNVDRNARRAAIPNQPSRPSAPVPDAAQQRPQASSRESVIANMRKARGQLVG